ncbi:MAG: membrane dipeptidase, partial [Candidatus Sulfotelmatobacter sp.]
MQSLFDTHKDQIEHATTAADIERIVKTGKIAAFLTVEGGHTIDDDLRVLRMYYQLGIRSMTLTHSRNNNWVDSSTDEPAHNGLTDFGKEVVREMNRLGMIVDVSLEGTLFSQPLMGGYANVDDDVSEVPGGTYRGVAPRSFDAKLGQWSIWWMDSRMPRAPMDPPVRGSFQNGVGTFYADDTENGKPIRIRFIWSQITPTSCHWEQTYSPDGGKTWETNWIQDLKRVQ